MSKKILIIGSGGREHALAWKLAQSPRVGKLFVAPGNGGTAHIAENVPIAMTEFNALIEFAKKNRIDLAVVGPDEPLALGIVDAFQGAGVRVWGPRRNAARIEASKSFAKEILDAGNISTARFQSFSDVAAAREYVRAQAKPLVIKANGLALGKGVYICQTTEEAEQVLELMMVRRIFGEAGDTVIIEEFLKGQEISIHAFCDGQTSWIFPPAQDHKTAYDGDRGPNTGGMGSVAPVPWIDKSLLDMIDLTIVKRVLSGLRDQGAPFVGCLFPGLMITADGPKVLEFNARFGDPETQSYMRLLKTDLLDIFEACVDGTLDQVPLEWHPGYAACVVLASGGYPGKYDTGFSIAGLHEAEKLENVVVFHAGTTREGNEHYTAGGRVLNITATAATLEKAIDRAYAATEKIKFEGMYFRRDIGARALGQEPL